MPKTGFEERMAKIEGILEQMDKRLNHLEGDISGLRADLKSLDDRLSVNIKSLDNKLTEEIRSLDSKLTADIKSLDSKLTADIKSLDSKLTAEIRSLNDRLSADIKSLDVRLNARIDGLFKWTVGLLLTMWVTIMMALVPILLRLLGMI